MVDMDSVLASQLRRRQQEGRLRRLTTREDRLVDFSSNGYLSLSDSSEIKQLYLSELQSSEWSLGSGGSRLLDGNTHGVEALESQIAAFHRAPAGLLFNSGFEANTGLLGSVPQSGDAIVYDELVHASVHDGMRLSRARTTLPFKHNCVESLEAVLAQAAQSAAPHIFIAVEAVYSMDGDVAPLAGIVECVERRLPGRGYVIVDEAHATGVLGDCGRGLTCALGLEDRVWARVHTFGKAMGCAGAIVLSSSITRDYLINYARSFTYTTAMASPSLAAIRVVYDFVAAGHAESRRRKLQSLVDQAHSLLVDLVRRRPTELLRIDSREPQSPILPIFSTRARGLAEHCQDRGFMLRAIVAPTVPRGSDRNYYYYHLYFININIININIINNSSSSSDYYYHLYFINNPNSSSRNDVYKTKL